MDNYDSWVEAEIKMTAKDKEAANMLLGRVEKILDRYIENKSDTIYDSGVPTSIKMALSYLRDARNWLELVPIDENSVRLSDEVLRQFKEDSK